MNRDALVPALLVVLGTTVATAVLVGTLQGTVGVTERTVTAVDNGGLAVALVAVFFLFESTDYDGYRDLGGRRMLLDGAYVFALGTLVTVLAASALAVVGVESLPATLGPLSVDAVDVAVSVAALFSGLYGFFLRNRRFFVGPAGASSDPA